MEIILWSFNKKSAHRAQSSMLPLS